MGILKAQTIDATTGNLWKNMIIYSIPLIIGTLIQNCFNAIDLVVLGNMADFNAVAAVGATTTIVCLVVNSFIGIVGGSKIILAHQFGAKKSISIRKTVDTAMITALGIGLAVAVAGVPFAPLMLHLTKCPVDCFADAVIYIRIYVASAPAILVYNFGSAVISSSGDSQRPMYYIIIGGVTNIVLNIVLCLILPQKVIAVAVATAASQVVGAVLTVRRLSTMEGDGKLHLKNMKFDLHSFRQIMLQGLPLALNQALYPLANLQIQSAINSFGVAAIAGNSACATIEGVPGSFSGSFSSTATVFMGQNLGASNSKRVRRSFLYAFAINCTICLVLGLGIYATGEFWLSLFLPNDAEGIAYGMIRMFYIVAFYPICAANGILGAAIQTYGYAVYTSVCSILFVCVFRVIWMTFLYPHFSSFEMLMLCFLVSWMLVLVSNIVGYFLFCREKEK